MKQRVLKLINYLENSLRIKLKKKRFYQLKGENSILRITTMELLNSVLMIYVIKI